MDSPRRGGWIRCRRRTVLAAGGDGGYKYSRRTPRGLDGAGVAPAGCKHAARAGMRIALGLRRGLRDNRTLARLLAPSCGVSLSSAAAPHGRPGAASSAGSSQSAHASMLPTHGLAGLGSWLCVAQFRTRWVSSFGGSFSVFRFPFSFSFFFFFFLFSFSLALFPFPLLAPFLLQTTPPHPSTTASQPSVQHSMRQSCASPPALAIGQGIGPGALVAVGSRAAARTQNALLRPQKTTEKKKHSTLPSPPEITPAMQPGAAYTTELRETQGRTNYSASQSRAAPGR